MSVIRPIQYPADKLDRQIHDGIISPPILDKNFAKLRNLGLHDGIPVTFSRASLDTGFDHNLLLRSYASGEAAFDHHPVSGQSYGLQVPAAASQLFTSTEDFSTSWAAGNCSVSTDAATAPDGNTTADAVIPDSGTLPANLRADVTTAATAHTYSAFFEYAPTLGKPWIDLTIVSTSVWRAWFNLQTGAKGTSAGSPTDYNIVDVGGGRYRCDITATLNAVGSNFYINPRDGDGNAANVTGDGTNPAFYVWGANLTPTSFATPYIPGSSRAATSATIALSSAPSLDLTNFTWMVRGRTAAGISTTQYIGQIDNGTADNRMGIFRDGATSKIGLVVYSGTVEQAFILLGVAVADNTDIVAACWAKANSFHFALNVGGTVWTDSDMAGSMPVSPTTKRFGDATNVRPWEGAVARDAMWNSGSESFVRQLVT